MSRRINSTRRALWRAASGLGGGRGAGMVGYNPQSRRVQWSASLMEQRMQGKIVLITGGAKRVGAAICRRLHAAGANLMVHYRSSAAEARALRSELNALRSGSMALVQADLLKLYALAGLVKATIKEFGRLDALINNASSVYPTPVGEITEKAWDDLVGTNLRAPLFLSQVAAKERSEER